MSEASLSPVYIHFSSIILVLKDILNLEPSNKGLGNKTGPTGIEMRKLWALKAVHLEGGVRKNLKKVMFVFLTRQTSERGEEGVPRK